MKKSAPNVGALFASFRKSVHTTDEKQLGDDINTQTQEASFLLEPHEYERELERAYRLENDDYSNEPQWGIGSDVTTPFGI